MSSPTVDAIDAIDAITAELEAAAVAWAAVDTRDRSAMEHNAAAWRRLEAARMAARRYTFGG